MSPLILSLFLAAASARDSIVVTPAWLAQHIHDPNLVLLHVGDQMKEGHGEHIAGARFASMNDVSVSSHEKDGLMLEMPTAEELRKDLEKLGISDDSRIVVYYAGEWVSPATRIVFTLDYAGLGARTSLLDGGLEAWKASGGAVTNDATPEKAGKLSPLKIKPIVVDAAFVNAHRQSPGYAVVDGRAAVYYDGKQTPEHMGEKMRTGHVAGAHSVPFTEVVDDKNVLKSPAELEALFTKAGVKPGDTVIGYCHIGQQATAMLFAARTLGHPVLLYDGSFQDWSRHTEYPVDNPAESK
jgi:thiosulfate/3-mercaptopyruvate sulfurtransferase